MRKQIQPFARTVDNGPFGKLDTSISEFRVSSSTKDRLQRLAHEQGIDLTSFLRAMCDERAHGLETMLRLHRARYLAASGKSGECLEAEK